MTPTETALRLSVVLTEREMEMYRALKATQKHLRDYLAWLGPVAAPRSAAFLSDIDALLSRIESEATQPANDPAPTTLGA